MKIRLTNTLAHIGGGEVFSLLVLASYRFIHWVDKSAIFEPGWFAVTVFLFATIAWEARQKNPNKLDSIVDIIAGNAAFIAVLWLGGVI